MKRIICLAMLLCLAVSALPMAVNSAKAESQYYIEVDITNQMVTVYDSGNISDSGIVRQMICSTGKNATPTPTGTYSLPAKTHSGERSEWYYFSNYNCYAKWATRIVGGILFHSVLYTAKKVGPTKASTKALGSKASHGCIRLRVEDAQWIALNCPGGTTCKIFKSGKKNNTLRKKLLSRTFSRDEQTYDQYTGRGATRINLSRGKKGPLVTELQNRLRALGYFGGAADGKFGKSTKTAVKNFQAACGLKTTGKVNNDLWNRLFADGAPAGRYATLVEGWQGPAVAVLQQALTDLKMYAGAVDGSFGSDTTAAVLTFQQCYNYPANGAATAAMQNDAVARAQSVKAQFGDTPYQMVTSASEVTLATVTAKSYTRLRSKPNAKGKKVGKLYKNTQVKVLADDGGAWVQVQHGASVGYAQRKYLNLFVGTEIAVSYEVVPETPPVQEEIPVPETPPVAEEIPVAEDYALAAPPMDVEPVLEPQEIAEAWQEPVAESQEMAEAWQEPVLEPQEVPEAWQEPVLELQEVPEAWQEPVAEPQEIAEAWQEPVAEPQEVPEVWQEPVAESQEIAEAWQEPVADSPDAMIFEYGTEPSAVTEPIGEWADGNGLIIENE